MTDYSDLVSWLRISAAGSLDPHVGQAADAIEALEKSIERLEAENTKFFEANIRINKQVAILQMKIGRVYAALETPTSRKALGEKE